VGESRLLQLRQPKWKTAHGKKGAKSKTIVIEKEKLRPRGRAPTLPSKPIEDRRKKEERRAKHKEDLRRPLDKERFPLPLLRPLPQIIFQ
jgi:hypothetical protein